MFDDMTWLDRSIFRIVHCSHSNALREDYPMSIEYVDAPSKEVMGQSYSSESESVYLTPCIYCGMPANSVDHIPPRKMRHQFSCVGLVAMNEQEVRSCRECNSALGARPLLTVTERRAYVKEYLRRHYASYLRIPNWTLDELQEFGDDLRRMIQRNMLVRDEIRQRLQWKTGGAYEAIGETVFLVQHAVSTVEEVATVLLNPVPVEKMGSRKPTDKKRCGFCRGTFTPNRYMKEYCCAKCARQAIE